MGSTNIYVLLLEHNKYYVGKSNSVKERFEQHKNGMGSVWTRMYKPISLEKTIDQASPFDEDRYVK